MPTPPLPALPPETAAPDLRTIPIGPVYLPDDDPPPFNFTQITGIYSYRTSHLHSICPIPKGKVTSRTESIKNWWAPFVAFVLILKIASICTWTGVDIFVFCSHSSNEKNKASWP